MQNVDYTKLRAVHLKYGATVQKLRKLTSYAGTAKMRNKNWPIDKRRVFCKIELGYYKMELEMILRRL